MMHHNPIKSSNLAAVGYDLSRQVLGVTFRRRYAHAKNTLE